MTEIADYFWLVDVIKMVRLHLFFCILHWNQPFLLGAIVGWGRQGGIGYGTGLCGLYVEGACRIMEKKLIYCIRFIEKLFYALRQAYGATMQRKWKQNMISSRKCYSRNSCRKPSTDCKMICTSNTLLNPQLINLNLSATFCHILSKFNIEFFGFFYLLIYMIQESWLQFPFLHTSDLLLFLAIPTNITLLSKRL